MSKLTIVTAVIVLFGSMLCVGQTQAQWPQTTFKDTRFSAEIGVKAYDRPGSDLLLPLINDRVTGVTLFDSQQATDLGGAAGAEVKFNFQSKFGRELEFRTIIADWDEDVISITGDDLVSPFFPVAGSEPTTVDYGYESDFFSVELMARRAVSPGIVLMFGPRIVSTKDRVNIVGSLDVDAGGGNLVNVASTQSTEATNILLGLQSGFELNLPISQDMYIQSYVRAGGYMNPTEVNNSSFTNFNTAPTLSSERKSTGSFLGEVGVRLYVDIFSNSLSTYVGYEATWIDGLAVAPAQLLTPAGSGVQTGNTPFFNALTVGTQFRY